MKFMLDIMNTYDMSILNEEIFPSDDEKNQERVNDNDNYNDLF